MKIEETISRTDALKQLKKPDTEKAQEPPRPERSERSEEFKENVEISDRALEMKKAREAVDSVPDVRADKVAEVKAQIEQGTYRVEPDKVAENIIRESLLSVLV